MSLAVLCLIALLLVLVLSCVSSVNVGLLALAAAWVIGAYIAPAYGQTIGAKGVVEGFPTDLFLTLTGTTLLFAAAQSNGTLAWIVDRGVRLCGGRTALMPLAFFGLAFCIAAMGAGNIAPVALIAPSAMALSGRLGISPLVMALAVSHGSVAGGLTPISPIGVVTVEKLKLISLEHITWTVFGYNAVANLLVAAAGYLLLRGWRTAHVPAAACEINSTHSQPFTWRNGVTLAAIAAVFSAVILSSNWPMLFGSLHLGLAAFTAAGVLLLLRVADEKQAFQAVPWNVIVMVCGVSMLVKLAETTGALKLFAELLASVASATTINGWLAFVTGGISIFSSTSSVVLPTFLPMVPTLVEQVGGGQAESLATAVVIGSNLVDVSPLSTIGALCIAAAPAASNTRQLFHRMLLWGFAMAPVAAIICQLLL